MTKTSTLFLSSFIFLSFSACGGGSESSSATPEYSPEYRITTEDSPKKFTLHIDENIITAVSCVNAELYDENVNLIADTNPYAGNPIPNPLTIGTYTLNITEKYIGYDNSNDILFYKSLNLSLNELPINKSITVQKQTAELYKLTIENDTNFIINTSSTILEVYDENLNKFGSTNPYSIVYGGMMSLSSAFVLNAGIYFFVSKPYSCRDGGGSFIVSNL